MQTLYNELISGTTEYLATGEVIRKPPTATMLRAARTIRTLVELDANNQAVLFAAQIRESKLLEALEASRKDMANLQAAFSFLSNTYVNEDKNDKSICFNGQQSDGPAPSISDAGSEPGDSCGSDTGGEGCNTASSSSG